MPAPVEIPAAVVADVDGTIAGADHQVSPRTLDTLAALERRGVPVILATGRSEANVLAIARRAGLTTPAIACNGALVVDPVSGDRLRVRTVAPADVSTMIELHRRTGAALTWWTPEQIFVTSERLKAELSQLGDGEIEVVAAPGPPPEDVLKIMLNGTAAQLDAIGDIVTEALPRVTRSLPTFWELSAQDGDKWGALEWLFRRLEIDPDGVLGIGDGGNDVRWLARVGRPVAMANAHPSVHEVAVAVAGHHADEGAAEFLMQEVNSWPEVAS